MAHVPHIKLPLTFTDWGTAVVEQDSAEEIRQCVELVLRTPTGSRVEVPEFGIDDLAFSRSTDRIEEEVLRAVDEWEPRARAMADAEIFELSAKVGVEIA
ncbi:MAG TPA: GPW/gp25 family protein [Solirubrobacterales bacterium]|nr:GPW/gp25 family protein [Solirubrobacterales bacterium]